MNTFSVVFILMALLTLGVQLWLGLRQKNCVAHHRETVPPPFNSKISLEAHHKAADYTTTNINLEMIDLIVATLLLFVWTIGGGLNLLDNAWQALALSPLTTGVAVLVSAFVIGSLFDLPISAYKTFVIEERFGFNKITPKLFVTDTLKTTAITLIFGIPLAWIVLWLMQQSGSLWWLYVWLVWMAFIFFMMWAYPAFISPIFNKFQPLEDQALRERIETLMEKTGFSSNGIFVMDGSRRSGHGNAYFTGLGTNKRIVFYDTLIESLSPEEIEAVLAHELGHFKHGHIKKRLISMAAMSLAALALLGWLINQPWFFHGLGIETPSTHTALMLFMLVMPVFTFFIGPIMSRMSRKHEFEADDFAAEHANAEDLIQALVKMYEENAATLTPDHLYSAFHDSHPPAPVRIAHLSREKR
ncbi:MAG TPA: M48 family peptidase [Chromatiales bacterium]|nr:M48 family peptidase [Chromatiales bacterium]